MEQFTARVTEEARTRAYDAVSNLRRRLLESKLKPVLHFSRAEIIANSVMVYVGMSNILHFGNSCTTDH